MYLKTVKEIIKAIKESPTVYVGVALTNNDVEYFQITKSSAIFQVRAFAKDNPDAEGDYRVRVDPVDRSIWIN